jgi:beta-phosphoglucomutase-like phosphatase (HAD superfamily)
MIKLIIFDLDGVLVDARELHYEALNLALAEVGEDFIIGRSEHLSTYDGLSTTKKLQMLTENKGLPENLHNLVWKLKQDKTIEIINDFTIDHRIVSILKRLKKDGKLY